MKQYPNSIFATGIFIRFLLKRTDNHAKQPPIGRLFARNVKLFLPANSLRQGFSFIFIPRRIVIPQTFLWNIVIIGLFLPTAKQRMPALVTG